MDKVKLIGFKNFYNKEEEPACIVYYTQEFEDWEKKKAVVKGVCSFNAYIRNQHMQNEDIGKEFEILWGKGYKGMAIVRGLYPIK